MTHCPQSISSLFCSKLAKRVAKKKLDVSRTEGAHAFVHPLQVRHRHPTPPQPSMIVVDSEIMHELPLLRGDAVGGELGAPAGVR